MIPIYRAKKIDSDEYVEGYAYLLNHFENRVSIISNSDYSRNEIDPSTLAIHFQEWLCLDVETDEEVKVFASLDAINKKGGSELELRDNFQGVSGTLYFKETSLMFQNMHLTQADLQAFSVTGIQE